MKKHSRLGASSSHRWMNCPGSVRMCERYPYTSSVYAEEGNAAHYVAAECLNSNSTTSEKEPSDFFGTKVEINGNWYPVTEEMVDAVELYIETVMQNAGSDKKFAVEKLISLEYLHPDLWGTLDSAIIEPFGDAWINDFKYGKGVVVDVENNPQCMFYALGAIQGEDIENVNITIVQPRAHHPDGPVRTWTISAKKLRAWGETVLKPAAIEASKPEAICKAGDWCKDSFCPALGECPAANDFALALFDDDIISTEPMPPELLTTERLGEIYKASGMLQAWVNACASQLQQRLEAGETSNYAKLVQKRSNRKWIDEETTRLLLIEEFGENNIYERKLKSPSQMVDVVKLVLKERGVKQHKKAAEEVLSHLWEKPDAGLTLAPINDPRPAELDLFTEADLPDFLK